MVLCQSKSSSSLAYFSIAAKTLEYCGENEPLERSFEPPFAEDRASKCIEGSHWLVRVQKTAIGVLPSNGC